MVDGSAVFLPLSEVEHRLSLGRALGARTWGEFRVACSNAGLELLCEETVDIVDNDTLPGDGEPFDAEMVPGFGDQAGPFCPVGSVMLDHLPEGILEEFGTYHETMMAAPFHTIGENEAPGIIAALTDLGVSCRRDDDLIGQASHL